MADPAKPFDRRARVLRRLKRWTVTAALVGIIEELGPGTVLASTAAAIAAPVAATAFVYTVSSMRDAQLAREAMDRAQYAARQAGGSQGGSEAAGSSAPAGVSQDRAAQLDTMLAKRLVVLDMFGGDPSTVPPVYARIIKQMLRDDDATLQSLNRRDDPSDAGEDLADRERRLRDMHAKLVRLAGQ